LVKSNIIEYLNNVSHLTIPWIQNPEKKKQMLGRKLVKSEDSDPKHWFVTGLGKPQKRSSTSGSITKKGRGLGLGFVLGLAPSMGLWP